MPKPPYILGAMKSALLLAGAAQRRDERAAHHIDKMNDEEATRLVRQAIMAQKRLCNYLEGQLENERRRG